MNTKDFAKLYIKQGFAVIPNKPATKLPAIENWQTTIITEDNIDKYFKKHSNIAIVLKNGLIDIDVDNAIAAKYAAEFLPSTELITKRGKNRHYVYKCTDELHTIQYNVLQENIIELKAGEAKCTVTMPPSIHQTQIPYEFIKHGTPFIVEKKDIIQALKKIVLGYILEKIWAPGIRQKLTLATTAILLRAGWGEEETKKFMRTIIFELEEMNINERKIRELAVQKTIEKYANGEVISGYKMLKEVATKEIYQAIWKLISADNATNSNIIAREDGLYYIKKSATKEKPPQFQKISNFILKPCRAIFVPGEGEYIDAIVDTKLNKTKNVRFSPSSFRSSNFFKGALENQSRRDISFFGTDVQVQEIKDYMNQFEIKDIDGTNIAGFTKDNTFVTEHGELSIDGDSDKIVFVNEVNSNCNLQTTPRMDENSKIKLRQLIDTFNDKSVVESSLGWLIACFFKDWIIEEHKQFPILFFTGASGSGKSFTTERILMPIWAINEKGKSTGGQTKFTFMKDCSLSNCIPVHYEEFKPKKLLKTTAHAVSELIRNSYDNVSATRGRKDLSYTTFKYSSPLIFCAEVELNETAHTERIIPIFISKMQSKYYTQEFAKVAELDLAGLGREILEYRLRSRKSNILEKFKSILESPELVEELKDRPRYNAAVAIFGIHVLSEVLERKFDHSTIITNMQALVYENSCSKYSKSEVSKMLEAMCLMSARNTETEELYYSEGLKENIHYQLTNNNCFLKLDLKNCHTFFQKWASTYSYEGDVLDYKAFKRQLSQEEYFVEEKLLKINKRALRGVIIDLKVAEKKGLELQDPWLIVNN